MTSSNNLLNADQVGEFTRRGFLVLGSPLISQDELQWCRETLMRLFSNGEGRNEGRHFDLIARDGGADESSPQLLKPSYYAKELLKFSFRQQGLAIARQLIGSRAQIAGDVAIFKPRMKGGPTPWHQDEAFREAQFAYQEISIWIALTDTTRDNGPMAYIPGSHRLGILPHRLQGNSSEANSIECHEGFKPSEAVVCPIPAGAMIIHHCRTVHGALANKTNSGRLAYVLSYSTPIELRKEHREFPWLEHLRSGVRSRRKHSLIRGGIFREILTIMKNDPIVRRNAIKAFILRREGQLRRLLRR